MTTRIAAHPLVVAAALGLLGPAAMADDLEEDAASVDPLTDEDPLPTVSADEFARVEAEWFAVRGLKV